MKHYVYNSELITANSKREAICKVTSGKINIDKIAELSYEDIPFNLGLDNKRISIDDKDFNGVTVYIYIGNILPSDAQVNYIYANFPSKESAIKFLVDNKKELKELCALYDKAEDKRKSFLYQWDFETLY